MLAEKSKGSKLLSDVSLHTKKTAYSSSFLFSFLPFAFGCISSLRRTIKQCTTIVNSMAGWVWWYCPIILELRSQRQKDHKYDATYRNFLQKGVGEDAVQ